MLLLPERCASLRADAPKKATPDTGARRTTAFSITYEFVYTPNHQHDGINE